MTRTDDGALVPRPQDVQTFEQAGERLKQAYQKNHDLFYGCPLTNAVANSCDICRANGSVYVISVFMNGQTFARYQGATLHDCVSLLLGTARALKHIYDAGWLYLDLKPENILTLADSPSMVQLFDFDSMVSLNEIENAHTLRTSYSKGFAPWEQQSGRLRLLGRHSDVYSLGAVFFYALWHRAPTAFDGEYDWEHMTYAAEDYRDALYPALSDFFRRTLASYHGDRYPSMDEVIPTLEEILRLSDRKALYVCSSGAAPNAVFYGREKETEQLRDMLKHSERGIACLCGMGGIGKSSLARQYLALHA